MAMFKELLKKIFFLPPLPTVIITVFGFGFVLAVAVFKIENPALQYLSYISSAYALVITITGSPHYIAFARAAKRRVESTFMKKIRDTKFGERFFDDIRFRTELSLGGGMLINFLYIAVKLFSGIYYRSVWFISLAAYYILLAVMRFILLHKNKNSVMNMESELKRYRLCGIMLLIINQALAGIMIFIVQQNMRFDYPGALIYVIAAYSFYSIITAVVNLVKFRKHGSPLLSAVKVINLVSAMVSIMTLETAVFARFDSVDDVDFQHIMTSITGGVVCVIVIVMAAFMIWKSSRQLKKLQITTKGEIENEQ